MKRQLLAFATSGSKSRISRAQATARSAQASFDEQRESVATDSKTGLDNYRARARYIEEILIENIACIEHLRLDLTASQSIQAPCFALLGANGVGKSTVLRAVGLALAGPKYVSRFGVKADELLRDGARVGRVVVRVSGYKSPVEMIVSRKTERIEFGQQDTRTLVLGYGSSRLLPTAKHRPKLGMAHAKIDNLFDPYLALTDAEAWLMKVREDRFVDAARTIAGMLPGGEDAKIERKPAYGVYLRFGHGGPRKLHQLSDGYQSMMGLVVDMLDVFYQQGFESALSAEGVVLVDELGNHLHPAWRLRIVRVLRDLFPRVQFIYSTHDPLCLRGLADGEVAVLRRDALGKVFALEDLPPVAGMRVEQLLTSEHFGLDSTVDPELEDAMKRYKALLALDSKTDGEQSELDLLRATLTDNRMLGSTRRERLLLELLDRDDAQVRVQPQPQVSAKELASETVNRLQDLMRRAGISQAAARSGK